MGAEMETFASDSTEPIACVNILSDALNSRRIRLYPFRSDAVRDRLMGIIHK